MKALTISCFIYAAGLSACAHQREKSAAAAVPQAASTSAPAPAPVAVAAAARTCSSDGDCGAKQLCIRSQCVDITPELAECSTVRVHFDFNDANLRQDDTTKLARMARCLKADHDLQVAIEGNADERGTDEWNIALGDKRATSVAQYLEALGVTKGQLKTVSYGKVRPLCEQHNEECWATNRRAALKPTVSK